MVIFVMPPWYSKAKEEIDKCVDNIICTNYIDWNFSHDSETLNDAKETILDVLVRISEQVSNPLNITKESVEKFGKILEDEKRKKNDFKNCKRCGKEILKRKGRVYCTRCKVIRRAEVRRGAQKRYHIKKRRMEEKMAKKKSKKVVSKKATKKSKK